jgi:Holliday junction resolvasome RuvABC endonuclease subunit
MKTDSTFDALALAQRSIEDAEHALNAALLAVAGAARAEKVVISHTVGLAFEKLRSARELLGDLEKLSRTDPG